LAWQWQQRGRSPVKPYWSFIADVVDLVCERWREPDQGIWELRVEAAHHVHSKVLCWVAVDRAVRLAERGVLGSTADAGRWGQTRDEIAQAVLDRGVDPRRGCFVQSFGSAEVDAALLLLPAVGFVDHRHPTMEATVDAVIADLDDGGLIRRYRTPDGLTGTEGVFVACTFWLVECLAGLGRWDEADAYFQAACGTGNDLGLFAEQHDPATGSQLGNFPQGLSHLAHIGAARALGRHRPGEQPDRPAGQQAGSANRP
jgi:GH15 family glucan-1,4-alpha-glucosidase